MILEYKKDHEDIFKSMKIGQLARSYTHPPPM